MYNPFLEAFCSYADVNHRIRANDSAPRYFGEMTYSQLAERTGYPEYPGLLEALDYVEQEIRDLDRVPLFTYKSPRSRKRIPLSREKMRALARRKKSANLRHKALEGIIFRLETLISKTAATLSSEIIERTVKEALAKQDAADASKTDPP